MKFSSSKIIYLLFILVSFNNLQLKADDYPLEKISEQKNELLIESNKQSSDLKNSIFYAEGDVVITNTNNEFIAKSKKAIFYKLSGKVKLIGEVEVLTSDLNKIEAGEILYYVNENKFEAISDFNKRVNTKFVFNEDQILNNSIEK
tara:strand:- start:91 stop:528 length:438 start_codon:yes stop_codon:yes gene_type:complete